MYTKEVNWNEENGVTIWGTSYQCCIMRKVRRQEAGAGWRTCYFFWTLLPKTYTFPQFRHSSTKSFLISFLFLRAKLTSLLKSQTVLGRYSR